MKQTQTQKEALRLFWLCWLAYTVIYIGRKNLSACLPEMIADGAADKLLGGAVGTGFLICYACGQLAGGVLGDRFSPRIMLSLGLFGAGTVNLLMGLNRTPQLFVVLWSLNGLFASLLWPTVIRCLSQGIPPDMRARSGALISTTIPIGSFLAYLVSAAGLHFASWRMVFLVCGSLLVCTAVLEYWGFAPLRGTLAEMQSQRVQRANAPADVSSGAPDRRAFLRILLAAGLPFFVLGAVSNGALKDGLDFWIPTYISERFGIEASLTSLLTGILPVVNILGVYIAKGLNTRLFRNEMRTSGAMFAFSATLLAPLCLVTAGDVQQGRGTKLVVCLLMIAVVSTMMLGINSQLLTFIPFRFGKIGKAATVTGMLNASSYAAAALSDFFAGVLSKHYGWTVTLCAFLLLSCLGAAACLGGGKRWKGGENLSL